MRNIGAEYLGSNQCKFTVWAPLLDKVELVIMDDAGDRLIAMQKNAGYHSCLADNIAAGTLYRFKMSAENSYPDPASHYQREDVHGPSAVVDHGQHHWQDSDWKGIDLKQAVLYELHVGTFTTEGSFEAIIPRLKDLADTGINVIELMPVSQFPGNRNWGYDGVFPYAVHHSYGGPEGLKKLVDACHKEGIAVFLDVVYNHLGPEGNYLSQFAPYFTNRYNVPWGDAVNFDGEWSDGVKDYFVNNALHWFKHYHIDGLRLDAVHEMYDHSAVSFWQLLSEEVTALQEKLGRRLYLTAECDYNSPRSVHPTHKGGMGMHAQWLDDFHHALYVMLDEEGRERYADFGTMEQLAKAYTDGFVHSGEWVEFRKRKHGSSSIGVDGNKFIAFNLNHDQVGNRVNGERLSVLVTFEKQKLAAAALVLSPYIPMLFMGEEYGETAPFFFFVSHHDQQLVEVVREGRKKEFAAFGPFNAPDPYDTKTFENCILHWEKRNTGEHKLLLDWHKQLIGLRKSHPALANFLKKDVKAWPVGQEALVLLRHAADGQHSICALFNFSNRAIELQAPFHRDGWKLLLRSTGVKDEGPENNIKKQMHYNTGDLVKVALHEVIILSSGKF